MDRVRRRGDNPGEVVEAEGIRGSADEYSRSDFGSGKGAEATGIRQV